MLGFVVLFLVFLKLVHLKETIVLQNSLSIASMYFLIKKESHILSVLHTLEICCPVFLVIPPELERTLSCEPKTVVVMHVPNPAGFFPVWLCRGP